MKGASLAAFFMLLMTGATQVFSDDRELFSTVGRLDTANKIDYSNEDGESQVGVFFLGLFEDLHKDWYPQGVGSTVSSPGSTVLKSTQDPAGHSCCVIPPPSSLNIIVDQSDGPPVLTFEAPSQDHWGNMAFDLLDGTSMSGESVGTVAGYSNIRSTFSGTLFADSIQGSFTVGADGGLPSSEPIIFEVDIAAPGDNWPFLVPLDESEIPLPILQVNGQESDSILLPRGEPVTISVGMEANGGTTPMDWWLLATLDYINYYYFDLTARNWRPGLAPTFQGTQRDLPTTPLSVFPDGIPVSGIDIILAVDNDPDGQLSADSLIAVVSTYEWED